MTSADPATERLVEYGEVVRTVVEWAAGDPDIEGIALVGSWARGDARLDSDLDLVVLTTATERYAEDDSWVQRALGRHAPIIRKRGWGALTERRVLLASGFEIDLGLVAPSWASTTPVDPGTAQVVSDGLRPLHDPGGVLADLVAGAPRSPGSQR